MNKKILSTTTALSLSALLGVGALIGVASGKNVVKANAATTSTAGTRLYIQDEHPGDGWTYNGVDAVAHMWNLQFDTTSGFTSVSDLQSASVSFGSAIAFGASNIDVTMKWAGEAKDDGSSSSGCRDYELVVPWYITSFNVAFFAHNNDGDRYLKPHDNPGQYSDNYTEFAAVRGKDYRTYLWGENTWSGLDFKTECSHKTVNDFVYDETTYTVTTTASPAAGGTVTGAGTYKKYQNATVTATANSGYSFTGWSDSGAASHSFHVTADAALTATFAAIPSLPAPTLVKAADNTITWSAVANATKYSVSVDGKAAYDVATTDPLKVDPTINPGTHTVSVIAVGDGVNYGDSNAAVESYTAADGYFLVGNFNGWHVDTLDNSIPMSTSDNGETYSCQITTTVADMQIKAVYKAAASSVKWQGVKDGKIENNPFADEAYLATFVNNNVQLGVAGTYTITIEPDGSDDELSAYKSFVPSQEFTLVVGNTEYPMTFHGGESGNEFKATGVNLTSGSQIKYKRGSTTISASLSAKAAGNNNIGYDQSEDKLIAAINNASADVYVDVVANTVWSGQNATPGYHMLKNGNLVTMTQNPNPSDDRYIEYYTAAIDFAENDEIRFIDVKSDNRPVVWDITNIKAGDVDNKFVVSAGRIKATASVTAAVYMKLSGTLGDEIYFGPVSEEERAAKKFASDFLTAINDVCDPQGVTTNTTQLATAWGGQVTAFGSLIEGAQNILKAATAEDSVKEIRDFIAQYTYVLTKYGKYFDASTRDFLNKGITPNPVAENHLLFTKDSTTTIAMVTIIAVVGLTAIGSVVYLRARKHQ